jgi:mobilization protein NikA
MPAARRRRVWIRFSEEEHASLAATAKAAGLNPSALLRDHLGKVRIRHREDERQRVIALNRINANLNMLARWCNTHKGGADVVQIMAYLVAVEREIVQLREAQERA